MTPIGTALRAVMRGRGLTVADLARDLHQPEPTVRNVADGNVTVPHRRLRDALDDYFEVPRGTTLSIAEGETEHYPADHLHELCLIAGMLPDGAVERLADFLRSIT